MEKGKMTKAEEAAMKAYPTHDGASEQWKKAHLSSLAEYIQGYEQAEKDLALTLEDIVRLDCLIMGMEAEGYNEGYKTRPFYEEVLRRFNKAKK